MWGEIAFAWNLRVLLRDPLRDVQEAVGHRGVGEAVYLGSLGVVSIWMSIKAKKVYEITQQDGTEREG